MGQKMRFVTQLNNLVAQKNCQLLKPLMYAVKSVYRHEEALAGGGSFAPQGGLIELQNLAIRVSRTTCLAFSTNLSSGWFHQDHR